MNKKILYGLIAAMLLAPIALTVVNAEDKPKAVEEVADPYYEACGEVEPYDDTSNSITVDSIKEEIGITLEDIQKLMAGTPTIPELDKLSKRIESSCIGGAALKVEERKTLDPEYKKLAHQYDELMTKVQAMEIPQTDSDE